MSRKVVTADDLRDRIRSEEATEDDFYMCFDSISDALDWPTFSGDWRAILEVVLGLGPNAIEDYSIYDNFLSAAAADGFGRAIKYAAMALGVDGKALDAALLEWHEDNPETRPDPGFETVMEEIRQYEKAHPRDRSSNER